MNNMKKTSEQIFHLRKEPVLRMVIDAVGDIPLRKDLDLYKALLRAIVSQQLSLKAAATIWGRFLDLFNDGYPDPKKLLRMSDEKLRAVGLSYQKAAYLKNIARFSKDETLEYKELRKMEDEDLIEYLTEIKGVGRWTVEMIMMFHLERPDVFPKDDLGIQQGLTKLYKLTPLSKKELFEQMERIAESWRPCRTLACRYIWKYKDVGGYQTLS
jgi:DNA-3-methyladenine glycosylase II